MGAVRCQGLHGEWRQGPLSFSSPLPNVSEYRNQHEHTATLTSYPISEPVSSFHQWGEREWPGKDPQVLFSLDREGCYWLSQTELSLDQGRRWPT